MLTKDKYATGLAIAEQLKYNIAYDKTPLFNVVCAGLAARLLNVAYAEELTDDQIATLNKIIEQ